jgi:hypothetical protein
VFGVLLRDQQRQDHAQQKTHSGADIQPVEETDDPSSFAPNEFGSECEYSTMSIPITGPATSPIRVSGSTISSKRVLSTISSKRVILVLLGCGSFL